MATLKSNCMTKEYFYYFFSLGFYFSAGFFWCAEKDRLPNSILS